MAKLHAVGLSTLPEIIRSKDYPVHLGESFSEGSDASYHSLQFKFKPQSAGRSSGGSLQIKQNTVHHSYSDVKLKDAGTFGVRQDGAQWALWTVQIALHTPNVQEGNPGVSFEGQWAPSQQGMDCVALFDGSNWRLELLSGVGTNIRSAQTHYSVTTHAQV